MAKVKTFSRMKHFVPQAEELLARILPAITAVFSPPTGTLTVTGDGNGQEIRISLDDVNFVVNNGDVVIDDGGTQPTVTNVHKIVVYGLGGNDEINLADLTTWTGATKSTHLDGGADDDTIYGSEVKDSIDGQGGHDSIMGYGGNDTIEGDAGNDCIFGDTGIDHLYGDEGHDDLWGGLDRDTVDGGEGNDSLSGSEGTDYLIGGAGTGADLIYGGAHSDTILGNDGNDTLFGESGADSLLGGYGADYIYNDYELGGDGEVDQIYTCLSGVDDEEVDRYWYEEIDAVFSNNNDIGNLQ